MRNAATSILPRQCMYHPAFDRGSLGAVQYGMQWLQAGSLSCCDHSQSFIKGMQVAYVPRGVDAFDTSRDAADEHFPWKPVNKTALLAEAAAEHSALHQAAQKAQDNPSRLHWPGSAHKQAQVRDLVGRLARTPCPVALQHAMANGSCQRTC